MTQRKLCSIKWYKKKKKMKKGKKYIQIGEPKKNARNSFDSPVKMVSISFSPYILLFFFWSDSLFHVLQKIIRNGKCELLRCLKLDFPRAYFFRLSHSPNDLCIYRLFKVTNFVIVRVHEILWYRNTCILRVCVCVRSSTQICDYNYKFTQRIMQDVCNGTCQIISNTIFHHNLF